MVNSEFWMAPSMVSSYEFLSHFRSSVDSLDAYLNFQPRYKFKDMRERVPEGVLKRACLGEGRYCVFEASPLYPISVVYEGLRQICIWNLGENMGNKQKLWWDYVDRYGSCLKKSIATSSLHEMDCFDQIKSEVGIDSATEQKIKDCVHNSFAGGKESYEVDNTLLQSHSNPRQYSGLYLAPAFFINQNLVKEELNPNLVVNAICDSLMKKPEFCDQALRNNLNWTPKQKVGWKTGLILLGIFFGVGIIVLLVFIICLRRAMQDRIQTEINHDIRNHVTDYMRFKNSSSSLGISAS